MSNLDLVIEAVKNKSVLSFSYDGIQRVVEPHAVGVSRKGNDVLRCFQVSGGHVNADHQWDLCKVDRIQNLDETGETFSSPRPGYARDDKHMTSIYAQI